MHPRSAKSSFLFFLASVQKVYAIVAMIFGATMFGQMLSPKLCYGLPFCGVLWNIANVTRLPGNTTLQMLRIYYRIYCSACWTGAWDRGRLDGTVRSCVALPLLVSL